MYTYLSLHFINYWQIVLSNACAAYTNTNDDNNKKASAFNIETGCGISFKKTIAAFIDSQVPTIIDTPWQ